MKVAGTIEVASMEPIDIASGLIERSVDTWEACTDTYEEAEAGYLADLEEIAEHINAFCKATRKRGKIMGGETEF